MTEQQPPAVARPGYPWREFAVLVIAGTLASLAALPYAVALAPRILDRVPVVVLVASGVVNGAILMSVAVGLGLAAARRIGLGAPLVEAWLGRRPAGPVVRQLRLPAAIGLGALVAVLIIALDGLVFRGATAPAAAAGLVAPARWLGFLASFSGGIYEELLTRLGLLSILAWLLGRAVRGPDGRPAAVAMWIAIALAAVLFGAAHLPATAQVLELSPLVIVRALVLNGLPALVYGWLYWRRGLEAAMVAHFSSDLILHVVLGS